VPLEVPVPETLVEPLERHVERWRPVLLSGTISDRLWISSKRRPINARGMDEIVPRITTQYLGIRLTPHDFRDCLATDVAINNPAEVRIASTLLGHRQTRTTERYYNQARQREAAALWQETILRCRHRARRLPRT
jgi:integrase/recombinase XerD